MRIPRDRQTVEEWRPGVVTRMRASASLGTERLCAFEQWSEPGAGAPRHQHPEDEELILVVAGIAQLEVDGKQELLRAGDTAIIPSAAPHAFLNTGDGTLHTLAVLSSAQPAVVYESEPTTTLEIGAVLGAQRSPRIQ